MNIVMIVPTGIGCEIGGHAGDANPVAKVLGACCDTLILHPNVVNASDINEMPPNALYVEGSQLDRFLEGKIELERVRSNKILLAVNAPVQPETINAVSAARVTIGVEIEIMELSTPLTMTAEVENGIATGTVVGWKQLLDQVQQYKFDALAIATVIGCNKEVAKQYYKTGGVNPWGGVEAKASRLIATALNVPVAHAPVDSGDLTPDEYRIVVDPRIAAEMVSECYLHCVLKGLSHAPRIAKARHAHGTGLSVSDVDCLVTPVNCVGRPHKACLEAGFPIIAVRENKNVLRDTMPSEFTVVDNYWEAVGVIMCLKSGVLPSAVRRPFGKTKVHQLAASCEG